MSQQQGSPPVKEFRVGGGIKVAIWRNESERDGRTVVQYSIKPQRRYRDRQTREWKTTEYFRPQDLPHLILAAQKAFEFTSLKEDEEAPEQTALPGDVT